MLVRVPVASLFAAPDELSEQVSQAVLGEPVARFAEQAGWTRVRTPDGYEGWLRAAELVAAPEGWEGPWSEVEDLWANLRARPDSHLAAVVAAPIGVRLPRRAAEGNWVQVRLPDGRELWTEARRLRPVDAGSPRNASPQAIVATARRFLGLPYLWGGTSPWGLDCSGFVQLVLRLQGIALRRDASQQAEDGLPVTEPAAADLVFFGPPERPDAITHVGMVLDRVLFLHAAGGDCVRVDRLTDSYYAERFRFFRRFAPSRSGNQPTPGGEPE
ncbi:MAG: hypothetical protein FJX77_16220 [Armatimonadetes bacterium]|nr:hypothetical protein [Armatimonadota bacterium]